MNLTLIAPRGLEEVVAEEAARLGATEVTPGRSHVTVQADLAVAYDLNLRSRTAQRVLLPVGEAAAGDAEELLEGVRSIAWGQWFDSACTMSVKFSGRSDAFRRTTYGAQVVKDGICDRFRADTGGRPSIDREDPDVRIVAHLRAGRVALSFDLSGESLHRRGYRPGRVVAPLKENLAASILLLAGWHEAAAQGRPLLDPMCGSGTVPVEAALMAAQIAPGLLRKGRWGFLAWNGHDPELWAARLAAAKARADRRALADRPVIVGFDGDARAVAQARESAERAGVDDWITLERRALDDAGPVGEGPGLVVVNPPYGHRLGEERALEILYGRLGDALKQRFGGWRAHVLAGDRTLAGLIGLKPERRLPVWNGPIECRLLSFPLTAPKVAEGAGVPGGAPVGAGSAQAAERSPFGRRLAKRAKHLAKWAGREGVTCYRVYDRDLPDYAVAVDRYERWVHVQEYAAPKDIPAAKARARLREVLDAVPGVLGVDAADVFLKVRRRQRGAAQYGQLSETGQLHEVGEGGRRFLVEFTDRLDTGLFLDHRRTRALLAERTVALGGRFLNLFCYTGAATVYAATGGARRTTSVDLSAAYVDRTDRNLRLNGIKSGRSHELIQTDCLAWLDEARQWRRRWDVAWVDPPTFSNSKSMRWDFEVGPDHPRLISAVLRLLNPGGELYFSSHARGFQMQADAPLLAGLEISEITSRTVPEDFRQGARPFHRTWMIRRPG